MAASKAVSITALLVICIAALYFTIPSPSFWTGPTVINEPSYIQLAAPRFTPEILLSAPRRSSAKPDPSGKLAIYTVSTYSFESHQKTSEIRVIDIATGLSSLITNEKTASEPNWLGTTAEALWLREGEKGSTELVVGNVEKPGQIQVAGTVYASISNVKLTVMGTVQIEVAITAKSLPNGTLYNAELEPKKRSTARLYDSTMVRHWDKYVTPQKSTIWYGKLEKTNGRWMLGHLIIALKNTRLESPIPPFGGEDDYDICSTGFLFVAKDP